MLCNVLPVELRKTVKTKKDLKNVRQIVSCKIIEKVLMLNPLSANPTK